MSLVSFPNIYISSFALKFSFVIVGIIPHGDPVLKKEIWKLKIMPKLRHFLWWILSKALPTAIRPISRGVQMVNTRQRCGLVRETIDHIFFKCPLSIMVWRMSQLPWNPLSTQNECCEEQFNSLVDFQRDQGATNFQKLLSFWIMRRICKSKCNLIFRKQKEIGLRPW